MKPILFLCCLLLVGNIQASELYRSVDKEGKVQYSDHRMPDDTVESLNFGNDPAANEGLPFETLKAKEAFPVTFYVFPDCAQICQQARDFLNKRGVPFSEKNLATQDDIDAFRKRAGNGMLPTLAVGSEWQSGFLAEKWNKELDIAGYPKIAPYRPKPATPRAAAEPTIPAPQ